MQKQFGFGLVEILVSLAVLGLASVGFIKLFGIQNVLQSETNISIKSVVDQRFLERAIWAQYDGQPGALSACDILSNSQISFESANICVSGSAGQVWAESKRVSDSGCTFAGLSNDQVLSLSNCTTSAQTLRDNINALTNKSEFKITLWSSSTDAMTCVLDNAGQPATVNQVSSNLQLKLRSDCSISLPAAADTNVRFRMPHLALSFFRKDGRSDGYARFYYKQG